VTPVTTGRPTVITERSLLPNSSFLAYCFISYTKYIEIYIHLSECCHVKFECRKHWLEKFSHTNMRTHGIYLKNMTSNIAICRAPMGLRSFLRDVRKFVHRLSFKGTPPFSSDRSSVVNVESSKTAQTPSLKPHPQILVREPLAQFRPPDTSSDHSPLSSTIQPHFSETAQVCFLKNVTNLPSSFYDSFLTPWISSIYLLPYAKI
jgi:hypothetical protein